MNDARDQATGLRRILRPGRLRVLPVAAGMHGTGKTMVVIELARAASASGQRAVILDQSRGEVAAALSLTWRRELDDLLSGEHDYAEVALPGPGGSAILPGARGIARLVEAGEDGARLFGGFAQLSSAPNLVILNLAVKDGAACRLVPPEAEMLLVARPGNASVTATYSSIKNLVRRHGRRRFRLLVNRADEQAAAALHANVAEVARRFLDAEVAFGGAIAAGRTELGTVFNALEHWSLAEFS